tara:strand:- start:125 stop:406 length:282 start_codon:yes stop_codon:yes gene_type:complete
MYTTDEKSAYLGVLLRAEKPLGSLACALGVEPQVERDATALIHGKELLEVPLILLAQRVNYLYLLFMCTDEKVLIYISLWNLSEVLAIQKTKN